MCVPHIVKTSRESPPTQRAARFLLSNSNGARWCWCSWEQAAWRIRVCCSGAAKCEREPGELTSLWLSLRASRPFNNLIRKYSGIVAPHRSAGKAFTCPYIRACISLPAYTTIRVTMRLRMKFPKVLAQALPCVCAHADAVRAIRTNCCYSFGFQGQGSTHSFRTAERDSATRRRLSLHTGRCRSSSCMILTAKISLFCTYESRSDPRRRRYDCSADERRTE